MPDVCGINTHLLLISLGGGFSPRIFDSENSKSVMPTYVVIFFPPICISFPSSIFVLSSVYNSCLFHLHCITSTLFRKKPDATHTQDVLFHGKPRTRARCRTMLEHSHR